MKKQIPISSSQDRGEMKQTWGIVIVLLTPWLVVAEKEFRISVKVDLGKDEGQNFGSLFELRDKMGRVRAGAGFLGASNTQHRSSRRTLHFFVKADPDALYDGDADIEPGSVRISKLPKPTTDSGVYLYDFKGRLYAKSRNGPDNQLRFRNPETRKWQIDEKTPPHAVEIGNGAMHFRNAQIFWNGKPIYTTSEMRLTVAEVYYTNGFLFFREHSKEQTPWINSIFAVPWTPESPDDFDLSKAVKLNLRTSKEFVYAWGQLGNKVVASTNTGGNYDFDGKEWRVLIEPDQNTSFQVYAIMNYYNRLWMGHYPTGNLFEYDGDKMQLMKGHPPVLQPAVDRAREAQTLAIYGGDVYCGVWPWGEVWKFDPNQKEWSFSGRMFDHPQVSDEWRHPYEKEMKDSGAKTWNHWGQRITSLVPMGDSLYIGTSAKNSAAFGPKYGFLEEGEKWKDYGNVFRLTTPGHLSVRTEWKDKSTTFEFEFGNGKMKVYQDHKELGETGVWIGEMPSIDRIEWGNGIYGKFTGRIIPN